MRIDKFLKVSRILKRRSVSKEGCESGKIELNGKPCKPSRNVSVGDVISVYFASQKVDFKVLDIKEHVSKEEADSLTEIINEN